MKFRLLPSTLYLVPVLLFFSCRPQKNLDEFNFLTGKWQGERDGMTLQEIWKQENNSSMPGEGVVLSGTDTLFHEKLKLELRENEIYYVATVPNHTDFIPFKLISAGKNKWIFESKKYDFPQVIRYHLIGKDSLISTMEGNDKGKRVKEEFYFKKIK